MKKTVLMFLAAYSVILLDVLLFRLGGPLDLLLLFTLAPLLLYWYFKQSAGLLTEVLLCANLALAYYAGSMIGTRLYYTHVSDDGMTLAVGALLALAGAALIAILSAGHIIARAIAIHRRDRQKSRR